MSEPQGVNTFAPRRGEPPIPGFFGWSEHPEPEPLFQAFLAGSFILSYLPIQNVPFLAGSRGRGPGARQSRLDRQSYLATSTIDIALHGACFNKLPNHL